MRSRPDIGGMPACSAPNEGQTHLEILHAVSSGDIAYWTGIQRAAVRIGDSTEAMPMGLRVTEVFRREDGAWKLVHRHADTLVSAPART